MENYKIAVIPGDGIGPEVISEGVKLLKTIEELDKELSFTISEFPWSCGYYKENGKMAEDGFMDVLKDYDAIYLGAIGSPDVPDHISLRDLLFKIRKGFDEYVNLRPIKLLKGAPCPLKTLKNTAGKSNEVVLQTGVFSKVGTERIIRYAYELARKEKKTLTSISKGNALNYSMVYWDETFKRIGGEYPDVETHTCLVDAACMFFVKEPSRFEIIVTSNLFGDIITDLGAAIAGGMGLAAGANINPEKKYPSMFEPIHGSAPDIAGQGKADPFAAIWSVSQMMDHFGQNKWGEAIIQAIDDVLLEGKHIPQDLGGRASTSEAGEAVRKKLKEIFN